MPLTAPANGPEANGAELMGTGCNKKNKQPRIFRVLPWPYICIGAWVSAIRVGSIFQEPKPSASVSCRRPTLEEAGKQTLMLPVPRLTNHQGWPAS